MHWNLYLFVESKGVAMIRWAILALVVACPAAMAQESDEEGRKLSAALTQADVDTLGACQARIEGMGKLVDAFQGWLEQNGHTEQLASARDARDKGATVIATFEELRNMLGSKAGGFDLASSEKARTAMATTFQRRSGENELDAYNRWRQETRMTQECRDAMKRARWRTQLEDLASEQ
jgi:hypothetical protein